MTSRLAAAAALAAVSLLQAAEPAQQSSDTMWWKRARAPVRDAKLLDAFLAAMGGSYANDEQVRLDPDFFGMRLGIAPIWLNRGDGRWLYLEETPSGTPDAPIRQRVFRLTRKGKEQAIEMQSFRLPAPQLFAGASADPERLEAIAPQDLISDTGCVIVVEPLEIGFRGATVGRACAGSADAAAYVTSEFEVSGTTLTLFIRGYDAEGRQVFGPTKGPYLFQRVVTAP